MDLDQSANHDRKFTAGLNVASVEKKFIKLYKHFKHLWDPHHVDYNNRPKRNAAYDALLPIYKRLMPEATRFHIRQKINILRSCYRKELRKYLASRTVTPEGKVINTYNPSSWKFHAMRFLDCDDGGTNEVEHSTTDIETSAELYEEELEFVQEPDFDSANDEPDTSKIHISPLYVEDDKPREWDLQNKSYNNSEENLLEREYNAISANVSCKLQRMNPQQRYHAELLINKVLIYGLKERLTDETDLTDVWRIEEASYRDDSDKEDDVKITNDQLLRPHMV